MRIDGQIYMTILRCAPLKVVTEKVLQVNAAQRPGRLQYNLYYHWPCRTKVQRAVKKQNTTTVHILTLHSAHISTFSFCTQQTPKIFQHETSYCSSQCVSQNIIIIIILLVISYRSNFLFHMIATKSRLWWNVRSIKLQTRKFNFVKIIFLTRLL
jgi:hypothetical protein